MNEIWKDIPGFPEYQVSNIGRVRSLKFGGEKIIKPGATGRGSDSGGGYFLHKLSINGKSISCRTHQLVAMSFLGHTPNGMNSTVDHINGDKKDNRVENLRIISNRENVLRSFKSLHGTGVRYFPGRKKCFRAVIHYKGKNIDLGYYHTPEEAQQAYRVAANKYYGDPI